MGCVIGTTGDVGTEEGEGEEEEELAARLDPWECPCRWDRWEWASHRSLGDPLMIAVSRAVIPTTGDGRGDYPLAGPFSRLVLFSRRNLTRTYF